LQYTALVGKHGARKDEITVAVQTPASPGSFLSQWWRVGGVFAIGFFVVFFIGAFVIQGETPSTNAPMSEIRGYFTNTARQYLVSDYLNGLAFILLFLPFLVILRGLLARAEGGPNIGSWLTFAGGLMTLAIASSAAVGWGALALGAAGDPEVDDSTVRTLMYMDAYGYSALPLGFALMILSASTVIYLTGVLWRWLAIIGLLVALAGIIGSAWVIEGNEESVLGILTIIGFAGTFIWVLLVSISMILKRELIGLPDV
jgi:hypothetical protein